MNYFLELRHDPIHEEADNHLDDAEDTTEVKGHSGRRESPLETALLPSPGATALLLDHRNDVDGLLGHANRCDRGVGTSPGVSQRHRKADLLDATDPPASAVAFRNRPRDESASRSTSSAKGDCVRTAMARINSSDSCWKRRSTRQKSPSDGEVQAGENAQWNADWHQRKNNR